MSAARTEHSGSIRRLLEASGWLLSARSMALALSFLQTILLGRILGPRAFGLLALVQTYTSTAGQLLDSRAWETTTTYLIRYHSEGNLAKAAAAAKLCFLVDMVTALAALGLVTLTAPWVARGLFGEPDLTGPLMVFALTLVAGAPTGASMVLLRVSGRFRSIAFYNAVTAGIRLAAIAAALVTSATLASVIWAYLIAACLSGGLMLVMGRRGARTLGLGGLIGIWRSPLSVLREDRRAIARFLVVTNGSGTLKLAHRFGDILLVGYALGPAEAGFVRLARSFSDLMMVPVAPMTETSYPTFASLWREGRIAELKRLVRHVTLSSALIGLAGLGVLLIAAGPVVRLTVGAEYAPAVAPLRLFAIGMAIAATTSVWHPLLLAVDRPGRPLVALLTGAGLQFALLAATIVPWGLPAVGVAYIVCHVAWSIVAGYTVRQLLRAPAPARAADQPIKSPDPL